MIELYLAERCPYCVKIRLFMEEEAIPYQMKPVPLGTALSPIKDELKRVGGRSQVPYMIDHDKNVKMFESEAILTYLTENYVKEL